MRGEPEAGEAAESQEPWAMEALAFLARRLAPALPTTVNPERRTPYPGPLARNIETLIHERMNPPC
jgi:endonuclease YncB( thermonuclease family)